MTLDFAAAFGCFADREFDVFNRIAPRLAVNAELDRSRAEEHVLAHGADDLIVGIGIKVLRVYQVVLLVHFRRRP